MGCAIIKDVHPKVLKLYIVNSKEKGKGVHAAVDFTQQDVIEVCHVIILQEPDLKTIHNTHLHDYYFLWGQAQKQAAIALGYGSLYNHSEDPNAEIVFDYDQETIDFICIKTIEPGDEITIDYHAGMAEKNLWFDVVD